MNKEEFIKYIYDTIPEDYTIGIHGITGRSDNLKKKDGILKEGLLNHGWGGMLSNIQMFGQLKDFDDETWKKIFDYCYACDDDFNIVNIFFAFPETMVDENNNTYFLGYYPYIGSCSKGMSKAGDELPLNRLSEDIGFTSSLLIFGYTIERYNSNYFEFVPVDSFITITSDERRNLFYKSLKEYLERIHFSPIDSYYDQDGNYVGSSMEPVRREYFRQLREFHDKKQVKSYQKI